VVVVIGQGPIGLKFTMLLKNAGAQVIVTDLSPARRALAVELGADAAYDPREVDLAAVTRERTNGRGADQVFVAVSAPGIVEQAVRASRPGARIVLFAQTSDKERIELAGADICRDERMIGGSYSADVDLQGESADLIFSGRLQVERLISHRVPLAGFAEGMQLALHPDDHSLKILVEPQKVTVTD
jgi:L-iditol 2-dehydrogenase